MPSAIVARAASPFSVMMEGKLAKLSGISSESNPYPTGTGNAALWEEGWVNFRRLPQGPAFQPVPEPRQRYVPGVSA